MFARLVCLGSLLGSLVVPACTPETPARPANAPSSPGPSRAASFAPLPDTAFQGAEAAPPISRFETRRIDPNDEGDDDGAHEHAHAHGAASRFHGAPVDLDLKSADLADVFRLLADVGHVNIVVDGTVSGTVTLRLKHVPWDQALDLVARTHGLALERDGNVIVVRTAAILGHLDGR